MRRSSRHLLVLAALALASGACNSNTNPVTPTDNTTPATTTESFTGTLNQNGGATFPFLASAVGSVTATLTTVGPDSTIAVGLSLGTWNGTVCSVVAGTGLFNDNALQGASVLGSANAISSLCVRIYDVGKVIDPVSYVVQVVHP